jgi:hypothetical protein
MKNYVHHEEQWPPVIKASLADVFCGIPAPVTEIRSGISTKSVSSPFQTNGGEDMPADIQRVGFFYTLLHIAWDRSRNGARHRAWRERRTKEHYVNELNSQQNASILNRGRRFGFLCSGSLQYLSSQSTNDLFLARSVGGTSGLLNFRKVAPQ